ncbi:hypothetical protein D3H55_07695 [Bacillus salacetis]|uniref:Uncharacterized protein n=1 Tax=Bacillus salacetis TaxID=2315464 RepID=A0A3A1R0R6_9BACI|nr:hypothetical protein [Bacillus salacetis]RIW35274.1 hypothetical protein D3H55_07695 [Bacillus salacetis]
MIFSLFKIIQIVKFTKKTLAGKKEKRCFPFSDEKPLNKGARPWDISESNNYCESIHFERKEMVWMEHKPLRQHPFDIMVRGRQEGLHEEEQGKEENETGSGDLFSNIETLMTAVSDLKPLLNKVMPYITKWTKS